MSIASKNSSHRRNDSGELVVFEAARYFSGGDENPCYDNSSAARDEGRRAAAARMSLDMAAINLPTIQKQYLMREKTTKKQKQPSSPGGRLASFLNSLFNQTNSKKKKKSKTSTVDDDRHHTLDQRRSSISHFTITTSAANYDSNNSSTYSAKTPTKSSYKDLKSFSDRQKAVSQQKSGDDVAVNEHFRFNNGSFRNPTMKWTADDEDQRVLRKFDDGEDSDSSSDLFDLPNLDYSRGLPVYGTTNMDRIRIGAPIASAAPV